MRNILIIRSASFQQLDLNLPAIKKKFPNKKICLLTHEHGLKLAEKYVDIDECIVYKEKSGFDEKLPVKELENRKFDAVIVPVSNISGVGFDNVFLFAMTINAKKIYICNMVSEITQVTRRQIVNGQKAKKVYRLISKVLAVKASVFFGLIMLFKYTMIYIGKRE